MSLVGFQPEKFDRLGGLYNYLYTADVPPGFSPNLQNCRFRPGSVSSRPGFTSVATKGGRTFFGFTQFIDNFLNQYLLTLDDQGNLDKVVGASTSAIRSAVAVPGAYLKAASQFGRQYLAFYGSSRTFAPQLQPYTPQGPIRQFDGTNLDPFVPSGPGSKDHNASTGDVSVGLTQINNVTSIETWTIGDSIQDSLGLIPAGATVTGIFPAVNAITVSLAALGSATGVGLAYYGIIARQSANGGSVALGLHGVAVSFVTRSGYITEPTAPVYVTVDGIHKVVVDRIPVGPPYVIARQLYFTLSGGADYYFLAEFQIDDNVTTTLEVDFDDDILAQGDLVNNLFDNFRLPDQAAVAVYNSRIATWGGLNQVTENQLLSHSLAFTNAGFDGGVRTIDGCPLGWEEGTHFTGGAVDTNLADAGVFYGGAWKVTGDGTTAIRGEIFNYEMPQRLLPAMPYSVSLWLSATGPTAPGNVHIGFWSGGVSVGSVIIALNQLTTVPVQWLLPLTTGLNAPLPNDLGFRVAVEGTPTASTNVYIDHVQLYPTNSQFDSSTIRVSDALNPERFDGVSGFISISKDDGQRIVACQVLRWYYYVFKERSMWVTFDDGVNPPSLWSTYKVSGVAGAASANAVSGFVGQSASEDFLVTAARPGAYIFFGGKPIKVSQEVQATWDRINWNAAGTVNTFVDPQRKVIYFLIPLDSATQPNAALTLDYVEGFGDEAEPGGRKWNLDVYPVTINAAGIIESSTNSQLVYYAGPKIYNQGGTTDDGTAIDAFYETAFSRSGGTGTSLFGGVSYIVAGSGTLKTWLLGPDAELPLTPGDEAVELRDVSIEANEPVDVEVYSNLETERARVRFEVNGILPDGTGHNFAIKRVCVFGKEWAQQRIH